jgi:hypothetical protein
MKVAAMTMPSTAMSILPEWQDVGAPASVRLPRAPFVVHGAPRAAGSKDLGRIQAIKIRAALMAVIGRKLVAALERDNRLRIVERQDELPAAAQRLAGGARISGYCDGSCAWLVGASVVPQQAASVLLYDLQRLGQIGSGWQRVRLQLHVLWQRVGGWEPGRVSMMSAPGGKAPKLMVA